MIEFILGRRYVLDFSDHSFSEFFASELDVDIDDQVYSQAGGAKGKRLRSFLTMVDEDTATRALQALWEHRREYLFSTGILDPAKKRRRPVIDRAATPRVRPVRLKLPGRPWAGKCWRLARWLSRTGGLKRSA